MSRSSPSKPLPESLTQAENLPSLPAVAMEVLRLSRDENAEFADYANVFNKDPALAVKLLRLANSPLFGLPRAVTDLKEATSVLGLRTVQITALGFSLVAGLPKEGGCKSFQHDRYWRRSLMSAAAAREIAMHVDRELSDEAFLCGILSHIGQLVMAHATPAQYERVLNRCEGRWPDAQAESRALGFDHHDVAETLLLNWGIPDGIRLPVVSWGEPEACSNAGSKALTLARILGAASHLVSLACDASRGHALAALHEAAVDLGVEPQQMDTLVLVLEHRAQDTIEVLEMDLPKGESHYELLAEARSQMVELSLGAAADLKTSERRASSLEGEVRTLRQRLTRDPLTGLSNRDHLDAALQTEVDTRLKRKGDVLGLLRIEVDGFHEIAETRGSGIGEEILRVVSQAIGGTSRATDLPARFSEDEFAVLASGTDREGLVGFGERLRKFVEDLEITAQGRTFRVTLSVGGAVIENARSEEDAPRLSDEAGLQLAVAREAGGNRVAVRRTPLS